MKGGPLPSTGLVESFASLRAAAFAALNERRKAVAAEIAAIEARERELFALDRMLDCAHGEVLPAGGERPGCAAPDEWLTCGGAAKLAGRSKSAIQKLCRRGDVTSRKSGHARNAHLQIQRRSLEHYLSGGAAGNR